MGGDGRRGQGSDQQDGSHSGRHPHDLSGPRVMAGSFETFAALHVPGDPVILYNIWDVGSAHAVVAAGAKALATGSHPAADANGWPDGERVPLDFALANATRIVEAVDVPVTVDFESAYSTDPEGGA